MLPAPVGARAVSASLVADGSEVAPDSRIGARIGEDISTDEAIAACQSSVGASVTAVGWVPLAAEGYTAIATPAASATGSAPGTRVVFLVAVVGNPSCWAALGVLDWTAPVDPSCTNTVVRRPPHPASTKQMPRRARWLIRRRRGGRGIGPARPSSRSRRQEANTGGIGEPEDDDRRRSAGFIRHARSSNQSSGREVLRIQAVTLARRPVSGARPGPRRRAGSGPVRAPNTPHRGQAGKGEVQEKEHAAETLCILPQRRIRERRVSRSGGPKFWG